MFEDAIIVFRDVNKMLIGWLTDWLDTVINWSKLDLIWFQYVILIQILISLCTLSASEKYNPVIFL